MLSDPTAILKINEHSAAHGFEDMLKLVPAYRGPMRDVEKVPACDPVFSV